MARWLIHVTLVRGNHVDAYAVHYGDGAWEGDASEVSARLRERAFACKEVFTPTGGPSRGACTTARARSSHTSASHTNTPGGCRCRGRVRLAGGLTFTPPPGVDFGTIRTPKRLV